MGTVVALTGQVGGAKLVDGLYHLRGKDLAAIVNTGDDYDHLTLRFSPDIDTVLYVLAGIASPTAAWEPSGESHALYATLKQLGGPDRMSLGDRSLAAPLLRTAWLAEDRRLTAITLDFCKQLGIGARVLPMSDDPIRTYVLTDDGEVSFQEYSTTLGCEPVVKGFHYAGAEEAMLTPEISDALDSEDLEAVILCPANPYHTIRPILEVPGMRELMRKRRAPVIAVTPIVGGKALKGSAGKMMRELRHEASARRVALEYLKLIDGFVIDSQDAASAEDVRACGMEVLVANTVMRTLEDRTALARAVLAFAQTVRERRLQEA
ncbi:MAG: YvcK family protein [Candidatus Parcubacteria bacterium]|nr:YvcK family protein [Burkholderiales bacterium]